MNMRHCPGRSALLFLLLSGVAAPLLIGQAAPPIPAPPPPQTGPPAQTEPPPQSGPINNPTSQEAEAKAKASGGTGGIPAAAPVDPNSYIIGAEDVIGIRVWREGELSGTVQVRPDGKIALPLIGELDATGVTPSKLRETLIEKYSEYVNKPELTVSILSVQSRKYHVTGEVNRPGSYALVVPTTILQALVNVGGFREFANLKKVHILREGKMIKFNYKQVVKGKKMDQNILLQAGDYIVVP